MFLTNPKWDFCLNYTPSGTCPWDMTSHGPISRFARNSVEWCKWWQIPSSHIMHVQLIGITHKDEHISARSWGAICLIESLRSGSLRRGRIMPLSECWTVSSSVVLLTYIRNFAHCSKRVKKTHILLNYQRISLSIPFPPLFSFLTSCQTRARDCALYFPLTPSWHSGAWRPHSIWTQQVWNLSLWKRCGNC